MTREINVNKGLKALIDDEEYELLCNYSWKANIRPGSRAIYAIALTKRSVTGTKKRNTLCMHRLIMNAQPGTIIDHINHNGLDNRKSNLRICTQSQNMANRSQWGKYPGTRPVPTGGKYWARITVDGTRHYLGVFDTIALAAEAYRLAAKKYYGEFASVAL